MKSIGYPQVYRRLKTRIVKIGDLKIGGERAVNIQSMLTSPTIEVLDCINEIKSLAQVDCELIRLTIPSRKDLQAVPRIRHLMKEEGIFIPLVADIHFSPALAVDACELFEKVRINPGNYSDSPKSSAKKLDGDFFLEGYEKLKESVQPLVKSLKQYDRALRIGVNHGSLSSRMIEQYGDSPMGMVQSALEMIQLFEEQEFDQIVVSLKSSNPMVVQKAYRLLAERSKNSLAPAIHLGVTEAGNGVMGRMKSLAGIGTLLADGIGDTIRVSLTEPSANEVIFARKLLSAILPSKVQAVPEADDWYRDLNHQRVNNQSVDINQIKIGQGDPVKVGRRKNYPLPESEILFESDLTYQKDQTNLFLEGLEKPVFEITDQNQFALPVDLSGYSAFLIDDGNPLQFLRRYYKNNSASSPLPIGMIVPIISSDKDLSAEVMLAGILSEGLVDFLLIRAETDSEQFNRILHLLQATRSRIVATDYIICPSCGRTLYDIQATAGQIKNRTRHLKGLKIGVMGCIVNGPGEMADADFGYVGSGAGKIDLYFGQERVCRNIDETQAVERLIQLIKEKGRWVDNENQ